MEWLNWFCSVVWGKRLLIVVFSALFLGCSWLTFLVPGWRLVGFVMVDYSKEVG